MARVTDFEPLYAAFERFLTLCVLGERSLLWPDRVTWTSDNVAEVKRRLIDNPILGAETSFDEKLAQQMDG
ncbi:MAG: hypothetical protein GX616_24700, partial [Planctomycetes bacterium]|nr:hypothetical protein [Planctomycetota bacterium]